MQSLLLRFWATEGTQEFAGRIQDQGSNKPILSKNIGGRQ